MNNKEIYEELLPVFLESQGLLKEFEDNVKSYKGDDFKTYITRQMEESRNPESVIDRAFSWGSTQQGITVWNNLHCLWADVIWINRNPVEAYSRADYEPHRTER